MPTRTVLQTIDAPDYVISLRTYKVSEYDDGRWICHPASYDPSIITDHDVQEDNALHFLSLDEIEQLTGIEE